MTPTTTKTAEWSYKAIAADHAAHGHTLHPESRLMFGASMADLYAVAARSTVVVVDDAPVSTAAPTAAPMRKAA